MDAIAGDPPFIMEADGKSMLFVPTGLKDGPLPTHYEPVESPVKNPLYGQQFNPTAKIWERPGNELHPPEDPRFPYVFTTYRLTELHCGGITDPDHAPHRRTSAGSLRGDLARDWRRNSASRTSAGR